MKNSRNCKKIMNKDQSIKFNIKRLELSPKLIHYRPGVDVSPSERRGPQTFFYDCMKTGCSDHYDKIVTSLTPRCQRRHFYWHDIKYILCWTMTETSHADLNTRIIATIIIVTSTIDCWSLCQSSSFWLTISFIRWYQPTALELTISIHAIS